MEWGRGRGKGWRGRGGGSRRERGRRRRGRRRGKEGGGGAAGEGEGPRRARPQGPRRPGRPGGGVHLAPAGLGRAAPHEALVDGAQVLLPVVHLEAAQVRAARRRHRQLRVHGLALGLGPGHHRGQGPAARGGRRRGRGRRQRGGGGPAGGGTGAGRGQRRTGGAGGREATAPPRRSPPGPPLRAARRRLGARGTAPRRDIGRPLAFVTSGGGGWLPASSVWLGTASRFRSPAVKRRGGWRWAPDPVRPGRALRQRGGATSRGAGPGTAPLPAPGPPTPHRPPALSGLRVGGSRARAASAVGAAAGEGWSARARRSPSAEPQSVRASVLLGPVQ